MHAEFNQRFDIQWVLLPYTNTKRKKFVENIVGVSVLVSTIHSLLHIKCLCTMFMDCIYVTPCSLVAHGFLGSSGPSKETNFTGYWQNVGTVGRTVP